MIVPGLFLHFSLLPTQNGKEPTGLDYSRVEVAAAARRDGCSCGTSPQVHHNKADAVRSTRPWGVNLAEF